MKFTLVIKEKVKQIVLTPETDGEGKMLETFDTLNKKREVEMFLGKYEVGVCNSGFLREFSNQSNVKNSVIILIKEDEVVN